MILLGLGSNIGDRKETILAAIGKLNSHPAITVQKVSALYETAPVGLLEQPDFLNAAVAVETTLSPEGLLDVCLAVELDLGRVRDRKWGPRTIDIDLLMFHDVVCSTDRLSLPHPFLHERCFVLKPLAEIAPDLPLHDGKTAADLLKTCPAAGVKFFKKLKWEGTP